MKHVQVYLTADKPSGAPESSEATQWLAQADIDGSPHTDASGATPELAFANLAQKLAERVAELGG